MAISCAAQSGTMHFGTHASIFFIIASLDYEGVTRDVANSKFMLNLQARMGETSLSTYWYNCGLLEHKRRFFVGHK